MSPLQLTVPSITDKRDRKCTPQLTRLAGLFSFPCFWARGGPREQQSIDIHRSHRLNTPQKRPESREKQVPHPTESNK